MKKLFKLVGVVSIDGLKAAQKGVATFEKRVTKALRPLQKFGRQVTSIGRDFTNNFTIPIAAAGVVIFKGIQAASDLGETMSKTNEIFGESSKEIENWSKTMDKAFGQSQQQAMDAASNFAIFGKAAGLTGTKLTKFSTGFTELASDMASFFNTKPDEAITAIGAAFRGENEPIRKYGILLNDATMRQKALELGIVSSIKKALTPQNKILAAQALILDQTKTLQGDFARTSKDLSNQTRIFSAEVKNLAARLGSSFLPVALKVMGVLRDKIMPTVESLVKWWNDLSPGVQSTVIQLTAFVAAAGPALIIFGKLIGSVKILITFIGAAKVAMIAFNTVLLASPVGIVIAGIASMGIAVGMLVGEIKKAQKEHRTLISIMSMEEAARTKFSKGVDSLIIKLQDYGDAIKDKKGLNTALGKEINELTAEARKMGYVIEGDVVTKLEALQTIQGELNGVIDSATGNVMKYTNAVKADSEATEKNKVNALAAAEALKKLNEARKTMMTDYQSRIEQTVLNEQELLNLEEKNAIEKATKLKASEEELTTIKSFYAIKRFELDVEAGNKEVEELEKTKEEKQKIHDEELAAFKKKNEEELRDEKAKQDKIKSFAMQTVNTLFSLFSMNTDNKITKIDQELEAQKDSIKNSKLNEEEKNKKFAELDEQADKKKKSLMLKQAKRDKASSMFAAGVGAVQMAINGFNTQPFFPMGLIMGGVASAIGAAQIAMIAAQPLPQLAEGALVKQKSGGVDVTVAEGGDSELIMPMRKGISAIVEGIWNKLGGRSTQEQFTPAMATSGGSMSSNTVSKIRPVENHFHIGTLIGNEQGYMELARNLLNYNVSEENRKGR